MSVESIIQSALANNPIQMKKDFEEEIAGRVQTALETKYQEMVDAQESVEESVEEDLEEGKVKEEDDAEDQEDQEDEDDEDEDDDNDDEVVDEMKKLHASSCGKMEMYKKVHEKYGCSKEKFEGLYAQYCK